MVFKCKHDCRIYFYVSHVHHYLAGGRKRGKRVEKERLFIFIVRFSSSYFTSLYRISSPFFQVLPLHFYLVFTFSFQHLLSFPTKSEWEMKNGIFSIVMWVVVVAKKNRWKFYEFFVFLWKVRKFVRSHNYWHIQVGFFVWNLFELEK